MESNRSLMIRKGITILIVLYFFLLSIDVMGSSFKLLGTGFAEYLIAVTHNPLVGLFIGILVTSIIQSSSVTTSIVVGLTASGALSIGAAIPIVMGANIGTSITTFIVSLTHIAHKEEFRKAFAVATLHDFFNIFIVLLLFPLELTFHFLEKSALYLTEFFLGGGVGLTFTSPFKFITTPVAELLLNLISSPVLLIFLALGMLFVSLRLFVKILRPFAETEFKHILHDHVFRTPLRSFGWGLILTVLLQSSSVSTSLLVPIVGLGMLQLERIFPYILGANIGTTVTALLASVVTGSPAAVTVGLVHFLFNVSGSAIVYPMRKIPIALSQMLAEASLKNRIFPITYVCGLFFILPVLVIYFFH
ncbi:MAG: Na/Pi symporter [Nanoarchaeota archaeon]|nr:Na/Pi symporter [Nanoarchaeota archaeon]